MADPLPGGFLEKRPASYGGGLFDNDFARRWDGSCAGWTKPLATFHACSDILLWNAYVIIAHVMWRLHPIIKRVPTAKITVPLICTVFLTCGASHLFSAYVIFNPIYVFDSAFKTLAGVIGACAAVYIAHDLVTVFDIIEDENRRLKILESRLEGVKASAEPAAKTATSHPWRRIGRAIGEGLLLSLFGLLLWVPAMTSVTSGLFRNDSPARGAASAPAGRDHWRCCT